MEILDLSSSFQSQPSLARFGATVIPHLGRIFTLGGVARNRVHAEEEDIIAVTLYSDEVPATVRTSPIHLDVSHPRPLIIGSSALSSGLSIVIFGGGAVCFSFGAFWNSACFTLDFGELTINGPGYENWESQGRGAWRYFQTFEMTTKPMLHDRISSSPPSALQVSEIVAVPRRPITSSADFAAILHAANPIIIEGLALGSCTELWTSEYLKDKIGAGRKVSISTFTWNFQYHAQGFYGYRLLCTNPQWILWILMQRISLTSPNHLGSLSTVSILGKSCICGHFRLRSRPSSQLILKRTILRLQEISNYQLN